MTSSSENETAAQEVFDPAPFRVGAAGLSTRSSAAAVLEESEETRSDEPMSDAALLQWLEKMLFNDPRRPLALGGSLQASELNSALVQRIATIVEASYTAREADYLSIEVDQEEARGFLLADLAGLPLPAPLDARNLGKRMSTHVFDKKKGLQVKLKAIDKQATDAQRGASALKALSVAAKADADRATLLQKPYDLKVPAGSRWHPKVPKHRPKPLERFVATHGDSLLGRGTAFRTPALAGSTTVETFQRARAQEMEERAFRHETWNPTNSEASHVKAIALERIADINESWCTCSEGNNDNGTPSWLCRARQCYATEALGACDQATGEGSTAYDFLQPMHQHSAVCTCMVCAWSPGGVRITPAVARFKNGQGRLEEHEQRDLLSSSCLKVATAPGPAPAPHLRKEARSCLAAKYAPLRKRARGMRLRAAPEEKWSNVEVQQLMQASRESQEMRMGALRHCVKRMRDAAAAAAARAKHTKHGHRPEKK